MSFGFGIGDFLAVIKLANKVRKDFVGAPKQFQEISTECALFTISYISYANYGWILELGT